MRKIAKLAEHIREETDDVCCYAKMALKAKENGDDSDAKILKQIALDEKDHMLKLHNMVLSAITAAKQDSTKEIPQGMLDVWEYEHDQLIEKMAHCEAMLDLLD